MKRLVGECARCLTCCENLQFVMMKNDAVMEWVQARNLKVIQESDTRIEIQLPSPCPHLKDKDCDLHPDLKPEICRQYPHGMPEYWEQNGLDPNASLGSQCGFRWEEQDEQGQQR